MLAVLNGCTTPITDPAASLGNQSASDSTHRAALDLIRTDPKPGQDEIDALQGLVYRPGYQPELRLEGMDYLLRIDPETLTTTLRRRLPRITDHDWLRGVCRFVSDHRLRGLDEALVSSWGRPWTGDLPEDQRPEYRALVAMYGPDAPTRLVWETFLGATRPSQSGLRARCWDLLHRLGARDELIALVRAAPDSDHPLLRDLNHAARSFGTIPWNREEMLWLARLSEPSRQSFWEEGAIAVQALPEDRRGDLEIRDLPIIVAAARHRPGLLDTDAASLIAEVDVSLQGQRHFREQDPGFMPGKDLDHRLRAHRDRLTWGDAAAMLLAQQALAMAPVRAHLFNFADRDLLDETTEYGGVIDLDESGRFNVREFPPRMRVHDKRFEASQEMFDQGYTSLFHFHYHAQKHRNGAHAGPGAGDMAYADNTRANCLVLTFIDDNTMNVDFYRHDGVLVDLGVILRPRL